MLRDAGFVSFNKGCFLKELKEIANLYTFFENDSAKNALDLMPIPVYFKNTKGIYLWRNRRAVEVMQEQGFETKDDRTAIFGKTDFDLFAPAIAQHFYENDQKIIAQNQNELLTFREEMSCPDGSSIENISFKKALFSPERVADGVVGCSLAVKTYSSEELMRNKIKSLIIQFMKTGNLFFISEIKKEFLSEKVSKPLSSALNAVSVLSSREFEVLFMNLRGFSNKESGRLLNISDRTVETYLNNLRHKLQISGKKALPDFIWDILSQ